MTIAEILDGVDYPVCHPPYRGSESRYITYQLIGQTGVLYAEGQEAETGVRHMITLWGSHSDVYIMLVDVKRRLETAGCSVVVDAEFYDDDARLHRIVLDVVREGSAYL